MTQVQELPLADDQCQRVAKGSQTSVIRKGHLHIVKGPLLFRSMDGTHKNMVVNVYDVVHTTFNKLTVDDLTALGMDASSSSFDDDLAQLFKDMHQFHLEMTMDTPVTVVRFVFSYLATSQPAPAEMQEEPKSRWSMPKFSWRSVVSGALVGGIGVMGTLVMLAFMALAAAINLLVGYINGTIFDAVLGTNLLPVIMLGGLVGLGLKFQRHQKSGYKSLGEYVEDRLLPAGTILLFSVPVMLIFGAVANWLVPQIAANLVQLAGYDGGFLSFVLWGTGIMLCIRLFWLMPEMLFLGGLLLIKSRRRSAY